MYDSRLFMESPGPQTQRQRERERERESERGRGSEILPTLHQYQFELAWTGLGGRIWVTSRLVALKRRRSRTVPYGGETLVRAWAWASLLIGSIHYLPTYLGTYPDRSKNQQPC